MKDIKSFLKENQGWWTGKDAQLIDEKILLKFASKALDNVNLTVDEIQDELSQYKDPDELDDAWGNQKLKYCKFEDELANLLANDDKYAGKEGYICGHLWVHAWDMLDDLRKL